ncbi:peptidoglycan editing factor PgeF [Acinetobacter sp. WZC-1]|uniref:peptidoglycan editing factor PgeF n=1 Tax=Acinetobacter sp. WZC-1 TaxID=3459034 RepID=UPI00403D70EE
MQFVQGLPEGVYAGQTRIQHPQAQPAEKAELTGFNLALHVQDNPLRVQQHRMALLNEFSEYGVSQLTWMNQTHSTMCHGINEQMPFEAWTGDGLVTQSHGHALMMMTADCLPVILGNAEGSEVASLHAGWRGLAGGIVENTLNAMKTEASWAWLGAAISQPCFEVGAEVREAFCSGYAELTSAFKAGEKPGKYYADLYAIARFILRRQGVETVLGGDQCSWRQNQDYYSYRRSAVTGRMAAFVFIR